MRELINGSFEPLWRQNARRDADKFKTELLRAPMGRRMFLAGFASTLLLEYIAQRRAVALPTLQASASSSTGPSVTGITNAKTGAEYPYIPEALRAMRDGDAILLPAGRTYRYRGEQRHYAHYLNTNPYQRYGVKNIYLGKGDAGYAGMCGGDYGTIQGIGAANNGRALVTPAYGILARDFLTTDTEMVFDPSTPAINFPPKGTWTYVLGSFNFGQFAYTTMNYAGIDSGNNSLIGVTGPRPATIPAGTIVTTFCGDENKAIFIAAGRNPGWTFTNIELAYTAYAGGIVSSIQQQDSFPNGPLVGSISLTNCFVHDCKQGMGLGHAGVGDTPIFIRLFDTELTRMGDFDYGGQTHNIYVGHVGEFVMDNCFSHHSCSDWLIKSRAEVSILSFCQIRGERTDSNPGGVDSSGCDFSNGGLVYLIGNIHQQSRNAANQAVNYMAEGHWYGSAAGGAPNHIQELYAVNCTFIGPDNGVGKAGAGDAPIKVNDIAVWNPPPTKLGQITRGAQAARRYVVQLSHNGEISGESHGSWIGSYVGNAYVQELLDVAANKLLTVASPVRMTGTASWNCYANYGDPPLYKNSPYPQPKIGNYYWWDAGYKQPLFELTAGGMMISATARLSNGSASVTGVTGLTSLASIAQLLGLTVFVGGVSSGLCVWTVDTTTNSFTMNGPFSGAGGEQTITFGYMLWCGTTYATALGDSIGMAVGGNYASSYTDGGYHYQGIPLVTGALIQVAPGRRLVVHAPPSGPSWATGVNFWAQSIRYASDYAFGPMALGDAGRFGLTKMTTSPIAFGGSWTSPPGVINKAQWLQHNIFKQNAAPIQFGADFTESDTGLTNNNPTREKLKWYRRGAINNNGNTADYWYTVVPAGGLSSYTDTIWFSGPNRNTFGSVSIWRGCAANPFDTNFPTAVANGNNATAITTAAGNIVVLAGIRGSGRAGAGFTPMSAASFMHTSYRALASAQTGLNVTEVGGNASDHMLVDVLVGGSAPPTLADSMTIASGARSAKLEFTIAAAQEGDVLALMIATDNVSNVLAVGQVGPPFLGDAVGVAPIVVIKNCLAANYSYAGGGLAVNGGAPGGGIASPVSGYVVPAANLTEANNIKSNPWNRLTFGSPSWGAVFATSIQADFDYRLASNSPAMNAAADPGSSPRGQDLVPHYQISWRGSRPDGTPIPAKAGRSDVGPGTAGSAGALS